MNDFIISITQSQKSRFFFNQTIKRETPTKSDIFLTKFQSLQRHQPEQKYLNFVALNWLYRVSSC